MTVAVAGLASTAMTLLASCDAAPSGGTFHSQLPPLPANTRRIYLVRHGQTDWNAAGKMQGGGFDIPLNDMGKRQAAAAAECLAGVPLDVVASSSLARAHATAEAIFKKHPTAARVSDARFAEMRFGGFEGMVVKGKGADAVVTRAFAKVKQQQAADPGVQWPAVVEGLGRGGDEGLSAGESTHDVALRTREGLESLMTSTGSDASHVCIVAHGRVNRVLLASLLTRTEDDIEQGNTCINVLDWDERQGTWSEILINYEGHTSGLQ